MPASGNRRCPTPELLRCNAKVIRRWFTYGVRQSGQTSSLSVTGQSSIRGGFRLSSSIADQDGNDVDQPPRTGACSPRCHKVHTSNNCGVGRSRRRTITASDDHGVGRSRRRTITASDNHGVGQSRRRTITASDNHGVGQSRRRTITASDNHGVRRSGCRQSRRRVFASDGHPKHKTVRSQ